VSQRTIMSDGNLTALASQYFTGMPVAQSSQACQGNPQQFVKSLFPNETLAPSSEADGSVTFRNDDGDVIAVIDKDGNVFARQDGEIVIYQAAGESEEIDDAAKAMSVPPKTEDQICEMKEDVFVPEEEQQCIPTVDKAAATDNAAKNMFGSAEQVYSTPEGGTEQVCAPETSDANPICGVLDHEEGVCKEEEEEEDPGFWGGGSEEKSSSKGGGSSGGSSVGKSGSKSDVNDDAPNDAGESDDEEFDDDSDSGIEYTITFGGGGEATADAGSGEESLDGAGPAAAEYQVPIDDVASEPPQAVSEVAQVELAPEIQDDSLSGHYLSEAMAEQAGDELHPVSHPTGKQVSASIVVPEGAEFILRGGRRTMGLEGIEGDLEDVVGGALEVCKHDNGEAKIVGSDPHIGDEVEQGYEDLLQSPTRMMGRGRGRGRAVLSASATKRMRGSLAIMFGFSGEEGDDPFSLDEEARKQGGMPHVLYSFLQAGLGLAGKEADDQMQHIAAAGHKRDTMDQERGQGEDQEQQDEEEGEGDGTVSAPKKVKPHTVASVMGYYA
jgi:hypothetical protein